VDAVSELELLSLHLQVELGVLNAVEERHITVPTCERKVDFFGGVVAMEQIIRGWCWGGMGSERVEQ